MHKEIIKSIARANPYTEKDVSTVFDIVDSYDDTIKVINVARKSRLPLNEIAHAMTLNDTNTFIRRKKVVDYPNLVCEEDFKYAENLKPNLAAITKVKS